MMKSLKALLGAVLVVAGVHAMAQTAWPSRPISVVIPFPPGGAVDTLMRTIQPELSTQLGQPVVIENKPGGGAQIGASAVLQKPADGYQVFAGEIGAFAINPSLYKNIAYHPDKDFAGVAMLVRTPMVMYGGANGRMNSLKAFQQVVATPGNVNYGSFGPGTAPHILGHLLSRQVHGAKLTHIAYKGAPPAIQAVLSNEVDLLFDGVSGVLELARSGRAVPLAVANPKRSEYFPNVPTTAELGYPDMVMDLWIGVAVKKGTPQPIIDRLHAAFEKAMAKPEAAKRFADLGYTRNPMTPAQFDQFIKSELDRYRPVIADTGVVVD
ncbi:MAG: tripartite tricarboxylate transporter substrate binding protein [Proteobacteria bacterium]|nr:tripartite tricarboxylate transporter substrate binding protein [Pseudomonadota bacterium]